MLKNNQAILPLDLSKYKSIALIGPNANQTVFGDYAWTTGDTKVGVTLFQGLCDVVGNKAKVNYMEGCDWWSRKSDGIAEAVSLVNKCDIAIVAIGT